MKSDQAPSILKRFLQEPDKNFRDFFEVCYRLTLGYLHFLQGKGVRLIRLLNQTINQVRKGDLDHKVANSVAYLSNVLVKVFEGEELQGRMEKLEHQMDKFSKEAWR